MTQIPPQLSSLNATGEIGALMRETNWLQSPLGPVETWPRSLVNYAQMIFDLPSPAIIFWGETQTQIYNEGYAVIMGPRHPQYFGAPFRDCWPETYSVINPWMRKVLDEGEVVRVEKTLIAVSRFGFLEEAYFTFTFSPLRDDTGTIRGILQPVFDVTDTVLSERRSEILRALAPRLASRDPVKDVIEVISSHPNDMPFCALYLWDPHSKELVLAAQTDNLTGHDLSSLALFAEASFTESALQTIADAAARIGATALGPWPEPAQAALVVPLQRPSSNHRIGAAVFGLSSRLHVDAKYISFLELAAGQVALALDTKRALDEAQARAEGLAELDRAKMAFFSNVSHEFRTPLTLILGPSEELLEMPPGIMPQDIKTQIEVVHRNALRLQKLVNTLLDFSRIEAGRLQACFEPTDLAALTAELASLFRSAVEKAGMHFRVDCPPLTEAIYVDRDMWEKVVLNLLSNAFKFTLAGEIVVTLRETGDTVQLSVSDTGSGIAADQLEHVFERFHRIEGSQARTHEGSGIGLAMVQELVRLHEGTVQVESGTQGSSFTVTLPKGSGHVSAAQISPLPEPALSVQARSSGRTAVIPWLPEPEPSPEASVCEPSPTNDSDPDRPADSEHGHHLTETRRPRIVWADDNADLRQYVSRLLSPLYDVEAVSNGETALSAIRHRLPDLVLTDIMMPRLDGPGLLRALRADERTRTLPVILLSAQAPEESRAEGLESAADGYLTKPFNARELLALIGTHLELSRLRLESTDALRLSEKRFRNMADNAPVMIWVTDSQGICTYLNAQWYQFTGTTPAQGLGHGWLESVHPDDREQSGNIFLNANARQEGFQLEYRLRRWDGQYRVAIDAAVPWFGDDGDFLGYIGSVIDVTDLKQVEQRLREADRVKDEFLAMVTHELRSPLTTIQGWAELLAEDDPEPDDLRLGLEIISSSTRQQALLLEDLLDIIRIRSGHLRIELAPLTLDRLLASALESVRLTAAANNITLEFRCEPDVGLVSGDAARLQQVIGNLLSNAIKFTPAGGRICLSLHRDGQQALIQVTDSGRGIAAEFLPHVFEPFRQASVKQVQEGLGLGLAIVSRLVELHAGSIQAESPGLGQGATFKIWLPINETSPTDAC